jgi:hypothetical protein
MLNAFRSAAALFLAVLMISPSSLAFNSPLSDEAIREAYFLGQRRDEKMARFLAKYKQHLAAPETGPYIASVELLTPFARVILRSSQQTVGYSAQQAAEEYRGKEESVAISVEVLLTASYGAISAHSTSERSGSPIGYTLRSSGFWKDIQVQVMVDDKVLKPAHFSGEPNYSCGDNGCDLTGATLRMELPAAAFTSDTATVQVSPPEGPEVFVDFDLTTLR